MVVGESGCRTLISLPTRASLLLLLCAVLLFQPASAGSLLVQGALNSSSNVYVGNGSISFFVNATSGRVGIGTSSPNASLQVVPSGVSVSGGSGGDVADVLDGGVAYRVHRFATAGSSNFTVPAGVGSVQVLVVAGGGGGGNGGGAGAGGGGAGGLVYSSYYPVTAGQSIAVAVGAGGAGASSWHFHGGNGNNSIFGSITAIGGGGGGSYYSISEGGGGSTGYPGGSGGGAGFNGSSSTSTGGAGTVGQGYLGGNSYAVSPYPAGGGGGAGEAGGTANGIAAGNGGAGLAYDISGTLSYYAGGGGGAVSVGGINGTGGLGGGGNGELRAAINSTSGTNGFGGGGGGGNVYPGGSGGSGVVIVRYQLYPTTMRVDGISFFNGSVGIGTSIPVAKLNVVADSMGVGGDSIFEIVDGGVAYRVHKFTTVGNSTFTPPAGIGSVDVLVVGGGGGGQALGGGGGAGGYIEQNTRSVTPGSAYTVAVGAGGSASGGDSYFDAMRAFGGGYGGSDQANGANGGSGGGGGQGAGVRGNSTQTNNSGGAGYGNSGGDYCGGGGGAGTAGSTGYGSRGGNGRASPITGQYVFYAGGGGGGSRNDSSSLDGFGGLGGGGNGWKSPSIPATAGTNGTGGGGGGGGYTPQTSYAAGAYGGSGVVIVRYPIIETAAVFQGKVGIGVTNPIQMLVVSGAANITGDLSYGCPSTESNRMVKVGSFCIDQYEAYITSGSLGNSNGNNTTAFAGSAPGVIPQGSITWFQAQQACLNAGKRLCTNAEWQGAVAGTPNPGSNGSFTGCNVGSMGTPANTGSFPGCVSRWSVYDMVGNLAEWVADWGQGGLTWQSSSGQSAAPWGSSYGNDATWNVNGQTYSGSAYANGLPAAFHRGGSYANADNAGSFALGLDYGPTAAVAYIGFRCCK